MLKSLLITFRISMWMQQILCTRKFKTFRNSQKRIKLGKIISEVTYLQTCMELSYLLQIQNTNHFGWPEYRLLKYSIQLEENVFVLSSYEIYVTIKNFTSVSKISKFCIDNTPTNLKILMHSFRQFWTTYHCPCCNKNIQCPNYHMSYYMIKI